MVNKVRFCESAIHLKVNQKSASEYRRFGLCSYKFEDKRRLFALLSFIL